MNQSKQRVAIVGAGISGLAAAHQLSRSDASLEITVFDASDRLGGVLQTERTDGFCIELGPDSVLSRMPWAVNLFRDLGISDQLINTNPSHHGVDVVCRAVGTVARWVGRDGTAANLAHGDDADPQLARQTTARRRAFRSQTPFDRR